MEDGQLIGKAATQERILSAATDLFLERGYERTTMVEVARRAGVSRATVFWHFSDKAGLFREAFSRLIEPFRRSLERDFSALAPEKRLLEQIALYQSFVAVHRRELEGFIRWAMEADAFRDSMITCLLDMHHRYAGALTETIAELVPADCDPRPLAVGLIVLLDGDLLMSFFDSSTRRAEERAAAVAALTELLPRREPCGRLVDQ